MSPTRGELGRPVSAWRLEWAGRREPPPPALGTAFGLVTCARLTSAYCGSPTVQCSQQLGGAFGFGSLQKRSLAL